MSLHQSQNLSQIKIGKQILIGCAQAFCPCLFSIMFTIILLIGTLWLVDELVEPARWEKTSCFVDYKKYNRSVGFNERIVEKKEAGEGERITKKKIHFFFPSRLKNVIYPLCFDPAKDYIVRIYVNYRAGEDLYQDARACGSGTVCWSAEDCIHVRCAVNSQKCWDFIDNSLTVYREFQVRSLLIPREF